VAVEPGRGLGLAQQPGQGRLVLAGRVGEHLDGHRPPQEGVLGRVHGPHPAPAEQAVDAELVQHGALPEPGDGVRAVGQGIRGVEVGGHRTTLVGISSRAGHVSDGSVR
jgi:hypothetical protein